MKIICELLKLSQRFDETVDYNLAVFRIELYKKFNVENSKDLWFFLTTLIEGGAKKIIVDMKDVQVIDSAGIGILINAAKMIRVKNGELVLSNVAPDIKNVFKTINLQNFIKTFNTDGEAYNFFCYV